MGAFHTQLLDLVGYTDYAATFADPARQLMAVEPFSYVVDANAANITQTVQQTFDTPMLDDADFVMVSTSQFARPAGATNLTANPAVLIQIIDLSSGRAFFAGPSPLPMVAGQGGFNFILPGPKTIKARATLRTTAISCQAQTFNGFYMAFHGARLWYR